MIRKTLHPALRFTAPRSIQRGVPLKALMGPELISLIGESLQRVAPGFNLRRFQTTATRGLDTLEFKPRAMRIAEAMAMELPGDFDAAAPLLIRSFGPTLEPTDGNGLAPFFYLPHSQLIARWGVARFDSGMAANYALTQRFTAEFSLRPFLIEHRSKCLEVLRKWTTDPNPHVRRAVSEGTRPRLPWGMRLPEFQRDPAHSLPLLETLKDDPELYVRRSIANHLGDIAKDHADFVFEICKSWIEQARALGDRTRFENRCWMARHAVRLPAKHGDKRAIRIRALASRTM